MTAIWISAFSSAGYYAAAALLVILPPAEVNWAAVMNPYVSLPISRTYLPVLIELEQPRPAVREESHGADGRVFRTLVNSGNFA